MFIHPPKQKALLSPQNTMFVVTYHHHYHHNFHHHAFQPNIYHHILMLIMNINYDHHPHRHHHDHDHDGHAKGGRDRLIEGSRGILQGTTAMLISFDASQVSITIIITNCDSPSPSP